MHFPGGEKAFACRQVCAISRANHVPWKVLPPTNCDISKIQRFFLGGEGTWQGTKRGEKNGERNERKVPKITSYIFIIIIYILFFTFHPKVVLREFHSFVTLSKLQSAIQGLNHGWRRILRAGQQINRGGSCLVDVRGVRWRAVH